jgi:hypothetical protein
MTRESTGKTALSVIKCRYYTTMWLLIGLPLLYFLRPSPIGAFGGDGKTIQTAASWFGQMFSTWMATWIAMHGTTWFMSAGMYLLGGLLVNGPAYQQWLAAGGHPFWDMLFFFNSDPPQVRAAIGIPPEYPICGYCGCSLSGTLGYGSNFGNVCPNCGCCNDTFPEG